MEHRKRGKAVNIRFTEEELNAVSQKMAQAGFKNSEAYLRKMALEGYIVRFDTAEVKELLRLISNATGNINQIAKRANESRSVHAPDVQQLLEQVHLLQEEARGAINIYKKARKFLGC